MNLYRLTEKGSNATPVGSHNIATWEVISRFLEMSGGTITEQQFLYVARDHDHPDGAKGYLYHLVNRNGWLEEVS